MTDDDPGRWPRDSAQEDFEAHRATELDRLARWSREQKLRPLTEALESHGIQPGDAAESWPGPVTLPDWWHEIPEPHDQCPWCQRPGRPSTCAECRTAREQAGDPAARWAWWARLSPAQRRLWLAARHGTDPWSGRRVRIEIEWTDVDADESIATARYRFHLITPPTAWDDLDAAGN
jgi:hypothetical protein